MAQRTKRKMTEEEEVMIFLKEEGFQEVTPEMIAKDPLLQKMVEDFEQELALHGYNSRDQGSSNRRRSRQQ